MFRIQENIEFNLDQIPENITRELLMIEINFDSPSASDTPSSSQKFSEILQAVNEKYKLSVEGQQVTQALVRKFAINNKKDDVLKFYATNCVSASTFFENKLSDDKTNTNFLNLIKLICTYLGCGRNRYS